MSSRRSFLGVRSFLGNHLLVVTIIYIVVLSIFCSKSSVFCPVVYYAVILCFLVLGTAAFQSCQFEVAAAKRSNVLIIVIT